MPYRAFFPQRSCFVVLTVAWLLSGAVLPAQVAEVAGIVRDSSGGVVPMATVIVRPEISGPEHQVFTGPDGRFSVEIAASGDVTVVVRAGGFAEQSKRLAGGERAQPVEIVLVPAGLLEALTVTASRGATASATPAATSVLTAELLRSSPAAMLDDQLKTVPGFSLFRRTSSRVANPTTQGLTMRGLSASGASRGLVLVDGVPLNDAFGGWIYWDRIPQTALDRVEVVRGGTSDLYGADAVGGVIQILTLAPTRPTVHASLEIGSRGTPRVSGAAGGARGGWSGFASGEWQQTDGYILVAPAERGPVDIEAASEYGTGYGNLGYQHGQWRGAFRGSVFEETRANGTPLTNNDTSSRGAVGELSGVSGSGFWLARGYGGTQKYNQSFSSVGAGRASESLTQTQHVPSRNAGATGQWTMRLGPSTVSVGADTRRVKGTSEQTTYTAGVPTGFSANGGVQWTTGGFARVAFEAGDTVTLVGSMRADRWSSNPTDPAGSPRDATKVSPKGGVAWRVRPSVTVHGAASRAFRAPTLNELFRNFRAGGSLTNANDQLQPETLTAAEGGVNLTFGTAGIRVVGFWNRLENAVTNVTVSTTPSLITRQRRNAGTIRAAGVELEEEVRIGSRVTLSIAQAFIDSTFVESVEPALTGKKVPQVPTIGTSIGGRFNASRGIMAGAQFRTIGRQFDDDLNTLTLRPAVIFDAHVSKTIGPRVQMFAAIENAFDETYDVGRTPVLTVGLPRTFRVGIRADLP